ncbi:hypothetical protein HDU97_001069 [Phlyctochytrium planicorne]|nr:hypothetical protein HDU97_001069 [Phlyctochytrium planicorne]
MSPLIDPTPILTLMNGFRASKILFTLVTTGIVDILDRHGPLDAIQVSKRIANDNNDNPPNLDALDRIMRAGVGLGLLDVEKRDLASSERFGITEISKVYLAKGSRNSLAGHPAWSDAFPTLFPSQTSTTNPFSKLYADPASQQRFQDAMHGHAILTAPILSNSLPKHLMETVQTCVDVGGATGALAVEVAKKWKGIQKCFVLDLENVVESAKKRYLDPSRWIESEKDEKTRTALSKVEPVAGDFLKDLDHFKSSRDPLPNETLPKADLFLLSRIIHDWDEATGKALLRRIYSLLPSVKLANADHAGAVVIAEALLSDPFKSGPVSASMQDINMLVQTGGRERSPEEYVAMLVGAGFSKVEVIKTGAYLDLVVGYKVV